MGLLCQTLFNKDKQYGAGIRSGQADVGSLISVCFHSFLEYSVPGSASQVCLLSSAEWESAGASPLPLIRAFMQLPLLVESKFKQ